jgi:hypothetical protein
MCNRHVVCSVHSAPVVSDAAWVFREGILAEGRTRGDHVREMEQIWCYQQGWTWEWPVLLLRVLWRLLRMQLKLPPKSCTLAQVLGTHAQAAPHRVVLS